MHLQRLARSIYGAFKSDRRRKYLVVEDFYPAYSTHDAALEAFRVFDTDHNGYAYPLPAYVDFLNFIPS
jgi:hypothetical protein